MSTLLYTAGARSKVPDTVENASSTVTVVTDDAPSTMPAPPDTNELRTDPQTDGGLTTHNLSSYVVPREFYHPNIGDANSWGRTQEALNSSISTVGSAAQREASGDWGHGTLPYLVGIEPTINGTAFNETYFDARTPDIQEGAGAYMTPARQTDDIVAAQTLAQSRRNARAAARSQYNEWHASRNGG